MPEKMLAVMKKERAPGAEMVMVGIPKIKPDEVLVKVKATSICGTDAHIYSWDPWAQGRIKPPMIFGHECAGEVVEVGNLVKRIKVGDFISGNPYPLRALFSMLNRSTAHLPKSEDFRR